MSNGRLVKDFQSKLDRVGYRSRIVSVQHISELREAIEGERARSLLNSEFYQQRLTHFSFRPPDILPEPKSLIAVAAPQPQVKVVFRWQGKSNRVMIPPTYANATDKVAEGILYDVLHPEGYSVTRAVLPSKLLAVRSGLGRYGRNNICYVPGMGSFHRLVAFYSDIPCSEEIWRAPEMMARCQDCQGCLRSCPASAIATDRFLLRAERCITFHNERPSEFPVWMDPSWHNCLVGCMHCQRVCPENADFLNRVEGDQVFSEEETALILDSTPQDRLPPETAKKLEQLNLLEDSHLLGRNLSALLRQQ